MQSNEFKIRQQNSEIGPEATPIPSLSAVPSTGWKLDSIKRVSGGPEQPELVV